MDIKKFVSGASLVASLIALGAPNLAFAAQTSLSVVKEVRNITQGSAFSTSATAKAGDMLEVQIRVKNTGSVAAAAVSVLDSSPSPSSYLGSWTNVSIMPGTYSGVFSPNNSIQFSSLEQNAEIVVTYQMPVLSTLPGDAASVCAIAGASASNADYMPASACVLFEHTSGTSSLSITKQVRNITQGSSFGSTVAARGGDVLEYRIAVRNTGALKATNVTVADSLNNASLIGSWSPLTVSHVYTGALDGVHVLGFAELGPGVEALITYRGTVVSSFQAQTARLCNTATTAATNASAVSSQACTDLTFSTIASSTGITRYTLSAFNDTKNQDATKVNASREDFLTYKVVVTNAGTTALAAHTFGMDLSGVLPLADMVDLGGGVLNGQTINFSVDTLQPGQSAEKRFRVRVKYSLANLRYVLTASRDNTVSVVIAPTDATASNTNYVAPRTGATAALPLGLLFALGITAGFALLKRQSA